MIASLGCGSLIWDLGDLPNPTWVQRAQGPRASVGHWQTDGPRARVEFRPRSGCRICRTDCRQGPLTQVMSDAVDPVPSLWVRVTVENLDAAVTALTLRDRSTGRSIGKSVARSSRGQVFRVHIPRLGCWATGRRDFDHVTWTALGPKFSTNDPPTVNEEVECLDRLSGNHHRRAEDHLRCAPPQLNTANRRRTIGRLGWTT